MPKPARYDLTLMCEADFDGYTHAPLAVASAFEYTDPDRSTGAWCGGVCGVQTHI